MGAGILPITFRGGEMWLLLGRERYVAGWKDSNLWADFGGGLNKGESYEECASRECMEELMGMLGDQGELLRQIRNQPYLVLQAPQSKYTCYVLEFKWSERLSHLPAMFNRLRAEIIQRNEENRLNDRPPYAPEVYLEKDEIRWVPIHFPWASGERDFPLRPHFVEILKKLV